MKMSYLFLLTTLHIPPLLHWLAQINTVHGNLYLTDHIMLGETIKVKNLQHQGLSTQLCVRNLDRRSYHKVMKVETFKILDAQCCCVP